jgi:hypothetical protein
MHATFISEGVAQNSVQESIAEAWLNEPGEERGRENNLHNISKMIHITQRWDWRSQVRIPLLSTG